MPLDPASLTPKQLAAATELNNRRLAKRSLIASACYFDPKYIPSHTGFHSRLAEYLEAVEAGKIKQLIISTPPQHGKLLADDTPVLTAEGWKQHGDLQPGDSVVGSDGRWTPVVAVSPPGVADRMLTLTDGSAIQCHAKHEWVVEYEKPWGSYVLETGELQALDPNRFFVPAAMLCWESVPQPIPRRRIQSITPHPPKPGRCIQVAASDGIYLTGERFVPTHNSRLVAQEFVSWFLGRNPTKRVVNCSYASGLAERNGMACRNRVAEPGYRQIWGTGLSESRVRIGTGVRRIDEWYLDNGIGGVKSVGIGGSITGFPADLLVFDDLFSGWQDAHSPTIRDKVWNSLLSDFMTRKSEGAPVVFIGTRWHPDDAVGRFLDPKRQEELRIAGGDVNWTVVNLRGIAREDDPLRRPVGKALFPEMKSAEFVRAQMALLGPYLSAALYDGDPVAKGGNYIDPDDLQVISTDQVPEGLFWCRAWDLAATEQDDVLQNDPDYTASPQGAIDKDGNLYIRHMIRGQWKWPKTRERIRQTMLAEYGVPVGIEAVAGFKTAYDNLCEVAPHTTTVREYGVAKDKLTRALPWTALAANKKVFLVAGEWIADFKAEAQAFPGGAKDDQIDAVSLVYEMLTNGFCRSGISTTPKRSTEREGGIAMESGESGGRVRRERPLVY